MSAVKRVEEKSGETAGRTQAISAAVQQQAASLQQMAGSGRSLDGLAQNMQDVVKKFTI
jgi:methyl-accepting chemotaxis protein